MIEKLCAGKAFLAKPALHVVSHYGLAKTVAVGIATTMTVGAVAVLYESATGLKKSIDDGDVAAALKNGADLAKKIHGAGGLSDAADPLDAIVSSGGTVCRRRAPTSRMLDALLASPKLRFAYLTGCVGSRLGTAGAVLLARVPPGRTRPR